MYTFAMIVTASFLVVSSSALSSDVDFEDYQKTAEEAPLRYIAGIPYGSVSGRVAEYFATLRTPQQRYQTATDVPANSQQAIELGSNFR